jgi:hypothetical protein
MNDFDTKLELWMNREPRDGLVAQAQESLALALAERGAGSRGRRARRVGGWTAAAASAVAAVWISMALTSTSSFARAQQRLNELQTLTFDIDYEQRETLMMRSHVTMTLAGDYREEMGDIVSVRNQAQRRNITLIHPARLYLEKEMGDRSPVDGWIELLNDLRHFDGKEIRLPGSRVIRGLTTAGWQVNVRGKPATLWATEEGQPVELVIQHNENTRLVYRFQEMTPAPAPAWVFDTAVPEGYRRADAEQQECERTGKAIWSTVNSAEVIDPATGETVTRKWMVKVDCRTSGKPLQR